MHMALDQRTAIVSPMPGLHAGCIALSAQRPGKQQPGCLFECAGTAPLQQLARRQGKAQRAHVLLGQGALAKRLAAVDDVVRVPPVVAVQVVRQEAQAAHVERQHLHRAFL